VPLAATTSINRHSLPTLPLVRVVGRLGHLIFIGRSGFLTHAEAEKSLRLFAGEVLPRLNEAAPAVAA
jgi:hypothetical protein